jgi:hypothetical protein
MPCPTFVFDPPNPRWGDEITLSTELPGEFGLRPRVWLLGGSSINPS